MNSDKAIEFLTELYVKENYDKELTIEQLTEKYIQTYNSVETIIKSESLPKGIVRKADNFGI